jgi:hypothetical protein
VANWVAGDGERLMFIYGGDDPWTAGAFELGAARDSYRFVAPGHGHGADLAALPAAERDQALAALSSWTGVTARLDRGAPTRRPPRVPLRP